MAAITLGNPNLFLKGIAELVFYDPATGDIVGFDNVGSDSAVTSSVNLQEVTGGIGNTLVGVFPDTVRLSGTYTSQAFSLATRKLISGGALGYGATAPVCETVTASSAVLAVTGNPVKHYGQPASDTEAWCYIKAQGASTYSGQAYHLDTATKQVTDFIATNGTIYDVFYFVNNASAESLAIPDVFNPTNVTVSIKYGVYAKQNNAVSGGTLQGWLYVIVPYAILNGDVGISANQTANATTDNSWMALSPDSNGLSCSTCALTSNNLAYYVYVPCGDAMASVTELAVPGGGISVAVDGTKQIPVKYVMPNDTLTQPVYTDLTYESAATATATVSSAGVVTGKAVGSTTITITLQKADQTVLTTPCAVTVTAT